MSVRSSRYIFESWFLDRLMTVLWFYLVLRGVGWKRGSTLQTNDKIFHACNFLVETDADVHPANAGL